MEFHARSRKWEASRAPNKTIFPISQQSEKQSELENNKEIGF